MSCQARQFASSSGTDDCVLESCRSRVRMTAQTPVVCGISKISSGPFLLQAVPSVSPCWAKFARCLASVDLRSPRGLRLAGTACRRSRRVHFFFRPCPPFRPVGRNSPDASHLSIFVALAGYVSPALRADDLVGPILFPFPYTRFY